MKQQWLAAAMAMGLAFLASAQETAPFTVDWPRDQTGAVDVSFLNHAPAGKDGYIRIDAGHLVRPDGKRFRIWGVNMTGKATLPEKADAPIVAGHLARLGINCVRFHFLDSFGVLVDNKRDDSRALDPAQLDKLDFFIAQLKQRGVYSNLNLNVGHKYKAGDGVKDFELIGGAKSLTYFDPRLIELQKQYAKDLLTHKNPYTASEYRNEPCVAIVEFVNENSLSEAWFGSRLIGKWTQKNPGTWSDIPASYAADLEKLYNQWLQKNLPPDDLKKIRQAAGVPDGALLPRLIPSEFGKAPRDRFAAEARFYMSVERDFFISMRQYLKEELGVKSLLVGNSDHGHGKTGFPQVIAASNLDVIDGHVYWQHPSYVNDEKGKKTGFWIKNSPMVDDPLDSTPVQLSRSPVAGMPYTVSEANHPFPAEYACEGVPILAAYAALQDWDGIFWYTFCHDELMKLKPVIKGHFDYATDPVKVAHLAGAAAIFLRGDVSPAKQTVLRSYTADQVIDSIKLGWKEQPLFTAGFSKATALIHGSRVKSFNAPAAPQYEQVAQTSPIKSDTGELAWYFGPRRSGVVVVDTPSSQAVVGFLKDNARATANLATRLSTEFCAITLSSMESQPIANAGKLLLTVASRVGNTGMVWNDKRTTLENWGTAPTRIQIVKGSILLKGLNGAKRVSARPLDGAGKPMGQPIAAKQLPEGFELPLDSAVTTWYVVEIER